VSLHADQLDAFWTVVESGSFHRAAEQLYISQSAVTQRIQALERALGHKVFVRTGRRVHLTEAGRMLSRHCQATRQLEATLWETLAGHDGRMAGRLAILCDSVEWRGWVLPEVAAWGRAHPALDLTVTLAEVPDPVAALLTGKADLVVGERSLTRRGIDSASLGMVAYALVIRPDLAAGWPDAPDAEQLATVRGLDFAPGDRILRDALALCLPDAEPTAFRGHFINSTEGLITWVLAGGGFAALPWHLVADHVAAGDLRRLYPAVTMRREVFGSHLESANPAAVRCRQALQQRLQGLEVR
jgi:LysR family transcriptional regulator (chromosome initiation inhibitor)